VINTRLGGHAITISGLRQLAGSKRSLHICEIGCGGGDNLRALQQYCTKAGIGARFTGIDMNADCIRYAGQHNPALPCHWICSDYALVEFDQDKPDIIFSSLFCHHLSDAQLVHMLKWSEKNSTTGFFINDLHRHWLAFYLIRYLTRLFSRSYLVKHDASLSVARSFRKKDWEKLFRDAGLGTFTITWRWAFRWLVTFRKPAHVNPS
jgi:2-polyprenyl-3-methyl-5-hydroxy-6-metoxy-1,4-benzoquinol methylase